MSWNRSPRYFDRHDWRASFQERNHQNPHDVEKGVLLFSCFGHVGGDRTDQSIAQQNAEKCADKRGGNLVSDFFRRSTDSAHGDDNTQHSSHNAEAGQRIGHGAEGRGRLRGIVMLDFHVKVEHLVKFERIDAR